MPKVGRTRLPSDQARHELRLEKFVAEWLKSGDATAAARAAGSKAQGSRLKKTGYELLREAKARGLLQARIVELRGLYNLDIGRIIEIAWDIAEGRGVSRTIVGKKGRAATYLEETDRLGALRLLARISGADQRSKVSTVKAELGRKMAALLGRALDLGNKSEATNATLADARRLPAPPPTRASPA